MKAVDSARLACVERDGAFTAMTFGAVKLATFVIALALVFLGCSSNEDAAELDAARTQAKQDFGCSDVNVTIVSAGLVEATGCSQRARYACTRDRDFWSCARTYGQ